MSDEALTQQTKPELVQAVNEANTKNQELLVESDQMFTHTRRILTKNRVGFYALGMGVGALTGYLVAKRLLETKYSKIADDEIAEMRRHYQAKLKAAEAQAVKLAPVKDIVTERGYASPETPTDIAPPMAVKPPETVKEDEVDTPENRRKVVEDLEESETKNIFEEVPQVNHEWDWHKERRQRSPDIPYVVHYDERLEMEYTDVTLTYYEIDDVLCNERDEIVDPDDRDSVVGEANLNRFGHGSNDPSIVYIRNDRLEILYEVVRSPNSFSEEVHGIEHDSGFGRNVERMRVRERDDPEA